MITSQSWKSWLLRWRQYPFTELLRAVYTPKIASCTEKPEQIAKTASEHA